MVQLLNEFKEFLQWGTVAFMLLASFRFPLVPVLAFIVAVRIPYELTGGSCLIPVPLDLFFIPLAAMIASIGHAMRNKGKRPNRLAVLLLVFLAIDIYITCLAAQNWWAYRLIIGISLAYTCAIAVQDRLSFWSMVAALGLYSMCMGLAYIRLGNAVAQSETLGTDLAVQSLVGDRNYRSFECALGIIIGWGIMLSNGFGFLRNRLLVWGIKPIGLIPVGVCSYVLIQTQSRGGMITVAAAAAVMALHRIKREWPVILVCGACALVVAGRLVGANVIQTYIERFRGADMFTMSDRVNIWQNYWSSYLNSGPLHLLFGNGAGAGEMILGYSPHNSGLRVLFEQGLLGVALTTVVVGLSRWQSWKRKDDFGAMQFGLLMLLFVGSLSLEPHYMLPIAGVVLGVGVAAEQPGKLAGPHPRVFPQRRPGARGGAPRGAGGGPIRPAR